MIKLTKMAVNPDSKVIQSETVEEYRNDQERGTWGQFFEGKSPPIDYWIIGELLAPFEVGKPAIIERYNRNGVIKYGIMYTSNIVVIEYENFNEVKYVTTENSVYKVEEVEEEAIFDDE